MKTAAVLLLGMLGAALFCNSTMGSNNCCFKFFPGRISIQRITSYSLTDDLCPQPAIILKTNKGSMVCVDPSESWVKQVTLSLDEGWQPLALKCRRPSSFPKYPNTP
ncbi:hypothetical protein OJAV_G00178670 [Oryzias javanicus]|uniref:C-C motif chemokine n=1 Tax=Oryzias javanicus TaxID=123683 RepID=A0A3S2LSI1_ORYJA|nr:hypothetical protein OJAV_G00178670 [Oryzias javanicus]